MVHINVDHMEAPPGGWHTFDPRLARFGNVVSRPCCLQVTCRAVVCCP